ncbi:hypothetical protein B0H34DRAFT_693471 [Crassisporium funariophilum]|nr:hypothetical protein B0H34DRAFT_693471 [Crassisporium funariophilum]
MSLTPNTPTTAHLLTSPTLSTTSTSSYGVLSSRSRSSTFQVVSADSDDEIVWTVSEGSSSSEFEEDAPSDDSDDFVVLSRPRSPAPIRTGLSTPIEQSFDARTPVTLSKALETQMSGLSLHTDARPSNYKKKGKKSSNIKKKSASTTTPTKSRKTKGTPQSAGNAYPSPAASPQRPAAGKSAPAPPPSSAPDALAVAKVEKYIQFTGLGARPIVDDISERQSECSGDNESLVGAPTLYEEASTFISSFLSNPDAKDDIVCRLTLLQSLIIELGLATSSLPASMKSARAFLKSRAFLNIREYIAVRGQGPEAVQRVMYPSKSALIKDIRKKKNRTSVKWVKQHGLQVLLVGCFH